MQSQPYRRGKLREHSLPFLAMVRGRDSQGVNPQDVMRGTQNLLKHRKRSSRPSRPPRPQRPAR